MRPSSLVPTLSGIVSWFPRVWPEPVGLEPYVGDNLLIILRRTVNTADFPRRGLGFVKSRGVGYDGLIRHTPINGILARAVDMEQALEAFNDWDNVTGRIDTTLIRYLTPKMAGLRDLPRLFGPAPGELIPE